MMGEIKTKKILLSLGVLVVGGAIVLIIVLNFQKQPSKLSFQAVLSDINKVHAAQTLEKGEDLAYIKHDIPDDLGFTQDELDQLEIPASYQESGILTKEEAKNDLDLFSRSLYYCYAGYGIFGKAAFDKAYAQAMQQIEETGSPMRAIALEGILDKNYQFIQDGHFYISRYCPLVVNNTLFLKDRVFVKEENAYYQQNKKHNKIISINNTPPENWMKLSIDSDGNLVYRISDLSIRLSENVSISYEDGTVEKVVLKKLNSTTYNSQKLFSNEKVNNVPIVSIRSFEDQKADESFLNTAEEIKNSPVAVIDLRGNKGGWPYYVQEWLQKYNAALVTYTDGKSSIWLATRSGCYLMAQDAKKRQGILPEIKKEYIDDNMYIYKYGQNSWKISKQQFKRVPNKHLLFVLTDSSVASAGESLIAALRNQDNVIFVGTNTNGCLIGATPRPITLSHSKIPVYFCGVMKNYFNKDVFQEGRGFSPDIWVDGDALQYTLNLISQMHIVQ